VVYLKSIHVTLPKGGEYDGSIIRDKVPHSGEHEKACEVLAALAGLGITVLTLISVIKVIIQSIKK